MTEDPNRNALEGLETLSRRLADLLEKRAMGSRFQRSEERSRMLMEQARRAQRHLEMAVQALESPAGRIGMSARQGQDTPRTTWLRERVQALVKFLSGREAARPQTRTRAVESGVLTGNTNVLNVMELIGALLAQGQKGVLRVLSPKETIEIHLWEGDMIHAYSHRSPKNCRLGDILVASEALTRRELSNALVDPVCHRLPLGEVLTGSGLVTMEQLEAALEEQVLRIFDRLAVYRDASYTFDAELPPSRGNRSTWSVSQLLSEDRRLAG